MIAHKRCLIVTAFLIISILPLAAQTAAEIDVLIEESEVTVAVSSRFVLGSAGLVTSALSGEEAEKTAYQIAFSRGWVKGNADDIITLRDLSLLVMRAFDMKGGVMYSLTRNSRYAHREMIYRRLIQGRTDPGLGVSGLRLLQIIGSVLNYTGEYDQLETELSSE